MRTHELLSAATLLACGNIGTGSVTLKAEHEISETYREESSVDVVVAHVRKNVHLTFKEPQGKLKFPYLIPSGPYDQMWDWDSLYLGVASLEYGSGRYLGGAMRNYFDWTNVTNGEVKGCLTPSGATETLYHAKPVLIQGALHAADSLLEWHTYRPYLPAMQSLLAYWDRTRLNAQTGLYTWHDQLESGADNMVTSQCPSPKSPECWVESSDGFSLSSADLMTFLYREHRAFASFLSRWAKDEPHLADLARTHLKKAEDVKKVINNWLWDDGVGHFIGRNVTNGNSRITNRVYAMGMPLWAGIATQEMADRVAEQLQQPDMLSPFGVRSTSNTDPRYNNDNIIKPYSNWRGPIWVNANAIVAYGLVKYGYKDLARNIAQRVVDTLAKDIKETGTWHECYHGETGAGLAAGGFLSWNMLGVNMLRNIQAKMDPFEIRVLSL
eukprot:comp6411_c0_seq1/m.2213 comp6411_c0_seq1/g.2213  ORF comp6411_c0_seq1/g.2213 comp6411_c0_seq1/m.2213 type:complete len:440 (-) comp6411_c0_seq1:55-1374(-)